MIHIWAFNSIRLSVQIQREFVFVYPHHEFPLNIKLSLKLFIKKKRNIDTS